MCFNFNSRNSKEESVWSVFLWKRKITFINKNEYLFRLIFSFDAYDTSIFLKIHVYICFLLTWKLYVDLFEIDTEIQENTNFERVKKKEEDSGQRLIEKIYNLWIKKGWQFQSTTTDEYKQ